ncbi:MAG: hypothetical protein U0992_18905 [Planctomycetaceae bacterium]
MTPLFDELSKSLADESLPRRETVRRLGLALTAAVFAPLGIEYARGGHHPNPHQPSKPPQDPCKTFCQCSNGRKQDQCMKTCKACGNNPSRLAGACGNYVCCGTGTVSCGGYCADTANDVSNCGACGSVCAPAGVNEYVGCLAGKCTYACYSGAVYCGEDCVYLDSDPGNCGTCGTACGASAPYCVYGTCSECNYGQVNCGNGCTDLLFDANNCGACGNVCSSYCYYGICDYYGGGGGYGGYGGWGGYWGYCTVLSPQVDESSASRCPPGGEIGGAGFRDSGTPSA